jgi:hypothetical protein
MWFLIGVLGTPPRLLRSFRSFFGADRVVSIQVDGVTLAVDFHVDESEDRRRAEAGLSQACLDSRQLAALCELPSGVAIRHEALPGWCRSVLGSLPDALIDRQPDGWTRRVNPPVQISAVGGAGRQWRAVASALGAFVTVAPRWAVIPAHRAADDLIKLEAAVWGVGLVRDTPRGFVRVSDAAPCVPEFGPHQWWLTERVYSA